MSGYSTNLFEAGQLEDKFLCTHCLQVLKDPVQTSCGHRFCKKCLEGIVASKGETFCRACKEEEKTESILAVEETYRDRAILRELSLLGIRCRNEGCEWTGPYKDYTQEHELSCPMAIIKCVNSECQERIQRHKLPDHLRNDCVMRHVQCEYCNKEMPFRQLQIHLTECPNYPVKCENCGKNDIPRSEIPSHTDAENGDCPNKAVPCKYKDVGCTQMIKEKDKKEHEKKYLGEHLLMLLQTLIPFLTMVQNLKDDNNIDDVRRLVNELNKKIERLASESQNIEKIVNELQDQSKKHQDIGNGLSQNGSGLSLEKLSKLFEKLNNKQTVLDTKIDTHEGIVAVLNNQIEKDADTFQHLEKQSKKVKQLIEALQSKIKAQDRIIALKDVALAEHDLRIQSLEMASYDGTLLWKIPYFSKKRQDAISGRTTSLYSPCFFTSRHGYKMCARIYLNGDGMGKGNHISLFFVIIKGPNDALLRWPFRQKVTLTWIDQNNRDDVVDTFRPDPTSSSFRRPNHDMNVASGCPLFLPLSQLDSPHHAYVKDDVAFVKVIVDTSDLV